MKRHSRPLKIETVIYLSLWVVVIALYLVDVMHRRAQMSQPLLDAPALIHACESVLPFIILWAVNNYLLIPRLLSRNRVALYFVAGRHAHVGWREFQAAPERLSHWLHYRASLMILVPVGYYAQEIDVRRNIDINRSVMLCSIGLM